MPKKITNVIWEASELPRGLSLNRNTGELTGTPTANAGLYTVPMKVTTNYGSDEKEVNIEVKAGVPVGADVSIGLKNVSV